MSSLPPTEPVAVAPPLRACAAAPAEPLAGIEPRSTEAPSLEAWVAEPGEPPSSILSDNSADLARFKAAVAQNQRLLGGACEAGGPSEGPSLADGGRQEASGSAGREGLGGLGSGFGADFPERRLEAERHLLLEQVAQMKDALEQRDFELASRPSHHLVQTLRNRVSELERRLGPAPEAFEQRSAETRQRIREDRRRHQDLQRNQLLEDLHGLGKTELVQALQRMCTSLGVWQLAELDEAVERVKSASSGPSQQTPASRSRASWTCTKCGTRNVAEANFCHNCGARRQVLRDGSQLRQRLGKVLGCTSAIPSDQEILAIAKEMREAADAQRARAGRGRAKSKETFRSRPSAAPAPAPQASTDPMGVLRHFMELFDVRELDGCQTAMNALFSRFGELNMLHKVVRDHLKLSCTGSFSVADTVRALNRADPKAAPSPERFAEPVTLPRRP